MQKSLSIILVILGGLFMSSCSEDSLFDPIQEELIESHKSHRKSCKTHSHMEHLLSDPGYKAQYEKRMRSFKKNQFNTVKKSLCTNPTLVPIAVHYQGAGNANASCLVDLAKRQVDILNADFQGKNSDITKWTNNAASSYPNINFGETCMKFVLADQNHPSGFGLSSGQPAVTINKTQGDFVGAWSGYLNIYVQFNTGALGYAPLGGAGNGDGVVIEATAFGAGAGCGSVRPETPYDLGRTTTHEVGHYLLLDHIWGNGCGQDDDVADTPNQDRDYNGCPSIGQSSCGSQDLHMNYMDYTNDACMYMFSAGQSQRMESYLNSSLSILTDNASNVISDAAQNGGGSTGNDDTSNDDNNDDGDTGNEGDDNTGGDDTGNNDDSDTGDDDAFCDTPLTATATDITNSKARLSWSAAHNAIRYQVRYRIPGQPWIKVKTEALSIDITDLEADTEYQYRIRTRCDYGWTTNTPIKSFITEADVDDGGDDSSNDDNTTSSNDFTVEITLDDFGSETSWLLIDENNFLVTKGGPYKDFKEGQVKTKNVSLQNGCYVFIIEDFYGDGMCCEYGNGSGRIVDASGNVVVESDGRFGFYDEMEFCIQKHCI